MTRQVWIPLDNGTYDILVKAAAIQGLETSELLISILSDVALGIEKTVREQSEIVEIVSQLAEGVLQADYPEENMLDEMADLADSGLHSIKVNRQ